MVPGEKEGVVHISVSNYKVAWMGLRDTPNSSSSELRPLDSLAFSQISATSSAVLLDLQTITSIATYIDRGTHAIVLHATAFDIIAKIRATSDAANMMTAGRTIKRR